MVYDQSWFCYDKAHPQLGNRPRMPENITCTTDAVNRILASAGAIGMDFSGATRFPVCDRLISDDKFWRGNATATMGKERSQWKDGVDK